MIRKIYDSDHFCWCDLCGEVIVGGAPQIIESDGLVTKISDLHIAHTKCWEKQNETHK